MMLHLPILCWFEVSAGVAAGLCFMLRNKHYHALVANVMELGTQVVETVRVCHRRASYLLLFMRLLLPIL